MLNIRIPNLPNLPNLTAISVRGILNKYGYYIAGVIAVIALLAAYAGTRQAAEPVSYAGNPELAFFVDESTGEEKVPGWTVRRSPGRLDPSGEASGS